MCSSTARPDIAPGNESGSGGGSASTSSSSAITNNSNNNNNANAAAANAILGSGAAGNGNNGSQYALCALGVGLVALGVVMIVWSIVPGEAAGSSNSSSSGGGGSGGGGGGAGGSGGGIGRNKASSVAFVLVGSGAVMLLLSLCLGMRNKQREQQFLQALGSRQGQAGLAAQQDDVESVEDQAHRYTVPSYEEAVGSDQYPVFQSNLRHSSSQLPAYDDLLPADRLRYESEGSEVVAPSFPIPAATSQPVAAATTTTPVAASNRRPGKTNQRNKLLPLTIRRIKSEKLHMKTSESSSLPVGGGIEPLTPPPQYEDKVAPL